jgi:membrane peptidoglycan carboxypeptidase
MAAALVRFVVRIVGLAVVVAGIGVLLAASIAPSATAAGRVLTAVDTQVLDFPPLPDSFGAPKQRSVILARDGTRLAVLRDENREIVALEDVPAHVVDAVVATEDAQFWSHEGVDWRAIARATVGNVRAGEVTSGASTITQQLVKTLTAQDEQTLERKLREAYYALELEERLSKDEILGEYLNRAYFGNGAYGIGTAAEVYFSKPVGQLTVAEAALLAGLIRAPELNDPVEHPEAARRRRDIVLRQMTINGLLDPAEAERLAGTPVALRLQAPSAPAEPFFVTYVKTLLAREPALGPDPATRLYTAATSGLTIRTTLDPRLDALADEAIRSVLRDPDGPQAALTAVDPRTGAILAIGVGPRPFGDGPGESEVTPAVPGLGSPFGRQPGSAFKAFEIVAALEAGLPPTYTIDTPSPYTPVRHCADRPLQQPWRPGNYSDGGTGVLDLGAATAKSSNVYFAHLVDRITGPRPLVEVARRMGVRSSDIGEHCAAVLGSEEVYGLDMASAFGTLANEGVHCEPYAIAEIRDRSGRTLVRGGGACVQAVDERIAAQTTALLQGPIVAGTATRNGQIGRPAAGKTGTTSAYRNAWFVGYVPQLSAATWVGHELPREMVDARCRGGRVTGGCLPTMIWQRFMADAATALRLPVEAFPTPAPRPATPLPDVAGRDFAEAVEMLAAIGVEALPEVVRDFRPAGTVVGQNPPAGTPVERGSLVVVLVADGEGDAPLVPDLVGLPLDEALARLRALALSATVVEAPVDAERVGHVVGQRPPPGEPAPVVPVRLTVGVQAPRETAEPTPSPTSTPKPKPQASVTATPGARGREADR